jgi:tRNA (guanine26-N2/guanine27-N2)-dimethyltransferase
MHEIGLRILLGFICREAAKYDKGIEPLICYSTDHYFRAYIQVKKGIGYANESVDNLKSINSKELFFSSKQITEIGPLWLGKIQNKNMIEELRTILSGKQLSTKNVLWGFLDLLEEEANASAFFYTTDNLASLLKIAPPKMEHIFKKLKEKGYDAARTHFSPTGFKTNAPRDEIKTIFKHQK